MNVVDCVLSFVGCGNKLSLFVLQAVLLYQKCFEKRLGGPNKNAFFSFPVLITITYHIFLCPVSSIKQCRGCRLFFPLQCERCRASWARAGVGTQRGVWDEPAPEQLSHVVCYVLYKLASFCVLVFAFPYKALLVTENLPSLVCTRTDW